MNLFKILAKKDRPDVIHYVVLVEAPFGTVSSQLTEWFKGAWRPSGSKLKYTCPDNTPLQAGTLCKAEFKDKTRVQWQLEVKMIEPNHMMASQVSGFFNGVELITIEERDNGIKVDYRLTYEIPSVIHRILWEWKIQDPFTTAVRNDMDAFKLYCQKVGL